jgi:hypothetical protein
MGAQGHQQKCRNQPLTCDPFLFARYGGADVGKTEGKSSHPAVQYIMYR